MNRLALAAVVALSVAGCGRGGTAETGTDVGGGATTGPAAAPGIEEVKARVRHGLVAIGAYSGELVRLVSGPGGGAGAVEQRATVVATAAGDRRETRPDGSVSTYDAVAGVERHAGPPGASPVTIAERRGLAPGPPDTTRGASEQEDVTLLARLLLDLDGATVSEASFEDRPAWVVQSPTRSPSAALQAEEIALTVDRASGVVVRAVGTTRGQLVMEVRLERLVVDPQVDRSQFVHPVPAGAGVEAGDEGFRRLGLGEVGAVAGYDPVLPAEVPDGFHLAEVAHGDRVAETGSEAHPNPPSRRVVSVAFHRGFQRIVVTTRLRDGRSWADPFGYSADADPGRVPAESVAIALGALAGAHAQVVVGVPEAWGRSQLWATTGDLVVTVSGDLGREELLAVAESLEM